MVSERIGLLAGRLSMKHLRLLHVLSEHDSLRKAADVLCLTQPAATKTLQDLESLIGEQLFTRTSHGLVPNVLGEAAIRYAGVVFKDLAALGEEMTALRAGDVGTVRIGAMNSQNARLLPMAIARLKQSHPRIDVTVVEETSDRLLDLLEGGDLDLVVARIPQGWSTERLEFEVLGEETITVVARRGHPADTGAPLALADLVEATWIVQLHPAPLREIWDQIFREARLPLPRGVVETSSTLLTVSLLERTDMVALLPRSVADGFRRFDLVALPIAIRATLRPYGLIRRKSRAPTPAMATVARILEESASPEEP